MDEYITKEQVIEWFRPYGHTGEDIPFYVLDDDIFEMKAADVAQVVHGRWETNSDRPDTLICSVCKCGFDMWKHDPHNFCPSCGVRMDEEASE